MHMNSAIGAGFLLNSCNLFIVPLLLNPDKSTPSSTNLIPVLVPLERVKWNFPPEDKNPWSSPASLGGSVPRERGGEEVVGAVAQQGSDVREGEKPPQAGRPKAGLAWQPGRSCEITFSWGARADCPQRVPLRRSGGALWVAVSWSTGRDAQAGVGARAGEGEPLADLMVTGSISSVPGSAERKGSWRGGKHQNSHLSHCSGCWLDSLWHVERRIKKTQTTYFYNNSTKPL